VYLLDTDICIYLLRGKAPNVVERLREVSLDEIGTTAITVAELRFGALRSTKPRDNTVRVEQFIAPLARVPFDDLAALHFARIKTDLSAIGQLIGAMDMLIAATTLAARATLVTNNVREYQRVRSLRVENWHER
jgi:tRNA(fMet)-specific endonuclease VapC